MFSLWSSWKSAEDLILSMNLERATPACFLSFPMLTVNFNMIFNKQHRVNTQEPCMNVIEQQEPPEERHQLTVIIQIMRSVENSYSEGLVLDCLNRLEIVKNKLGRSAATGGEVGEAIRCLKEYLLTVRINRDVFDDMQKEICALRKDKEALILHHQEALQNLEMLVYQNDQEGLKARLTQFKALDLPKKTSSFPKPQETTLHNSRLDQSFMLQDEQNQFLDCVQVSSKVSSPIKESLMIMNSPPLQKNAEVWMEIMFSKNSEEERRQVKREARQLSQFTEIIPTEVNNPALNGQTDRQFSGKKVKSMILLKEKTKKGNSKGKTSAKKQLECHKQAENAETNSHSKLKKRILFPNKPTEAEKQSGKKKMIKQCEISNVRSFRKTIINNL